MSSKQSVVSFVKGKDVKKITREAIRLIGGLEQALKPGDTVLIKPNFGVDLPSTTGGTTNPEVVAALIGLAMDAGAKKVLVGESSVVGYNAGEIFEFLGVRSLFEKAGAELVNMDADKSIRVNVPNGKNFEKIRIHSTAWESDFIISVPVMKTHFQTVVSLGMKNMKGILPDSMKKLSHRIGVKQHKEEFELEQSILDLNSVIKPNLVVIDGVVAQEGYKPGSPGVTGSPLPFDTVVAGFDPVATDATGAYLMGFDPMNVPLIRKAYEQGLGEARIEMIQMAGTPVSQVRKKFQPASLEGITLTHENIKLTAGSGCSGCRETSILALAGMKPEEIAGIGETELIIGENAEATSPDWKKILIGNCAKDLPYEGKRIEGCPPPSFYIKKCLKGEEDTIDW
ncbi:MAG: DUF362 domain-containing protein [Deltaproteobacteria bacterium]|nr:DUF362 domain-containing protein [Deltaproteobacteria bacterium]